MISEEKRTYNREYQRSRRANDRVNQGPSQRKLARARQIAKMPAEPDRHRINGAHQHTCIDPNCRRRYPCENACDPVDEGLKNSICPPCYAALIQESPCK